MSVLVFTVYYTVAAQCTKCVLCYLKGIKFDIGKSDTDCNQDFIRLIVCIMTLHIHILDLLAL